MANGYFQEHIEEIIRRVVSDDRYGQLTAEQITDISVQLTLFISNILLSVTGALVIAAVAYFLVNRHQTQSAKITKEIERQRLLHELENQFQALSVQPCVWLKSKPGFDAEIIYHFIIAMTREVQWTPPEKIQYHWHTGDRLVVFTDQGDLISSTVLHEVLFWFRRLYRAVETQLIYTEDLYGMWRQLLPFVTDNRYQFMAEYFGGAKRRGTEDIEAISKIAIEVIGFCQKHHKTVPLDYLNERLDPVFFAELPNSLRTNLRAAPKPPLARKEPVLSAKPVNIAADKKDAVKL